MPLRYATSLQSIGESRHQSPTFNIGRHVNGLYSAGRRAN